MTPSVYLLDVEGTVAPLTLVSEQLFPYAKAHLGEYLKQNLDRPEVQEDLRLLAAENRAEQREDCPTFGVEIRNELHARAYLQWLMEQDRKSTALKSLQGRIWKAGFESGELKGTLFDDVPMALERWAARARVAIYSSGSVEAQRLVFRYSNFGDLTPRIAGYFDTRIGAKAEAASYAAIARELGAEPGEIAFCSDAVRELDAARAAGCATRLAVRPGNAPVDDAHGHALLETFDLL
jgi:2,3-diketo-5-methylthio-1-phosphopentane phosphatase